MLLLGSMRSAPAYAQPGPSPAVAYLGTPPDSGTGDWNVAANWSPRQSSPM